MTKHKSAFLLIMICGILSIVASCDFSSLIKSDEGDSNAPVPGIEKPKLLSFSLKAEQNAHIGTEDINGIIDEEKKKVLLIIDQSIIEKSKLFVPSVQISNESAITPPSDEELDLNNAKNNYIITRQGQVSIYSIDPVIRVDASQTVDLTGTIRFSSFILPKNKNPSLSNEQGAVEGIIDANNKRVILILNQNMLSSDLLFTPSFTLDPGITAVPPSNVAQDFTNPVVYNLSDDENSVAYTVELVVDHGIISKEVNNITFHSFLFRKQENPNLHDELSDLEGIVDTTNKRVVISVKNSTFQQSPFFIPFFTLPDGVTAVPASGEKKDFSNAVTYTLTKDSNSVAYAARIAVDGSSIIPQEESIQFSLFSFAKANNPQMNNESGDVSGVIDTENKKVVLTVKQSTYDESSSFVPTFQLPAGVSSNKANRQIQDFSRPVMYTLTKGSSSTAYTVEVVINSSSIVQQDEGRFEEFKLTRSMNPDMAYHELSDAIGIIDATRKKITLTLRADTYATTTIYTPTFTLAPGVSANPASGEVQDFAYPVFYTLTKNGKDQTYEAQIVIDSTSVLAKKPYINSFIFEADKNEHIAKNEGQDIEGLINHEKHEIVLLLRQATMSASTRFIPTITTMHGGEITPDATVEANFESSVFYTVTKNEYTQSYKVTAHIAEKIPNSIENTMVSVFDFEQELNYDYLDMTYKGAINQETQEIEVELPSGVFTNSLEEIRATVRGNYKTIQPDLSNEALKLDSNNKQQFIITDFNGNLKTYTVTVIPKLSDEAVLKTIKLEKAKNSQMTEEIGDVQGIIDHRQKIILFYLRASTYESNSVFFPTIEVSDFATIIPLEARPIDLSENVITYDVTSESGKITNTYRIHVSINRDSIVQAQSAQLTNFMTSRFGTSYNISKMNKVIKKKDEATYGLYLTPPEYAYFEDKPVKLAFDLLLGGHAEEADEYVTLPHTYTIRSKDSLSIKKVTVTREKLPVPTKICATTRGDIEGYIDVYRQKISMILPRDVFAYTKHYDPTVEIADVNDSMTGTYPEPRVFRFYRMDLPESGALATFSDDDVVYVKDSQGREVDGNISTTGMVDFSKPILVFYKDRGNNDNTYNFVFTLEASSSYEKLVRMHRRFPREGFNEQFIAETGNDLKYYAFPPQMLRRVRFLSSDNPVLLLQTFKNCDLQNPYDLYERKLYVPATTKKDYYILLHMDENSYDTYSFTSENEGITEVVGTGKILVIKRASGANLVTNRSLGNIVLTKDKISYTLEIHAQDYDVETLMPTESLDKIVSTNYVKKALYTKTGNTLAIEIESGGMQDITPVDADAIPHEESTSAEKEYTSGQWWYNGKDSSCDTDSPYPRTIRIFRDTQKYATLTTVTKLDSIDSYVPLSFIPYDLLNITQQYTSEAEQKYQEVSDGNVCAPSGYFDDALRIATSTYPEGSGAGAFVKTTLVYYTFFIPQRHNSRWGNGKSFVITEPEPKQSFIIDTADDYRITYRVDMTKNLNFTIME